MIPEDKFIVFFDGVCKLCNRAVQFIVKHDRSRNIMFASLQSKMGEEIKNRMTKNGMNMPDSVILFERGHIYVKAKAVLHIARQMGGIWRLAGIFTILPRPITNALYDLIAKNRYSWFGKSDECLLPTPELQSRML